MKRSGALLGCLGLLLLGAVIFFFWGVGVRNRLVRSEEAVNGQWAQVESAYQRRFDLIPNLVRTVQGAANFEKSTLEAVVNARAQVGQTVVPGGFNPNAAGGGITDDPQAFQRFEQAQANLSGALSRLLVVVERYPELRANQNFLDLQAELAGTENRINVERSRYNDAAQSYNADLRQFPANLIANMSGLKAKQYFKAAPGSDRPPEVNFDFSNTAATTTTPAAPATATR